MSTTSSDAAPMMLRPDWAAPPSVETLVTLRHGGVSAGSYGDAEGRANGWNMGAHVGDDPRCVSLNRERLRLKVPGPIRWLEQVHGTVVHHADLDPEPLAPPVADAAVTLRPMQVLAVMTADCLPVVLADDAGRCIGVAHAGWRGLASGVIEATVAAMRDRLGSAGSIVAWLGPAIGPAAFEVGDDVRNVFLDQDGGAAAGFSNGRQPGKWQCDLYLLARRRLAELGIDRIGGGDRCTVAEPQCFYSHRRDRVTGRFASLVWIRG